MGPGFGVGEGLWAGASKQRYEQEGGSRPGPAQGPPGTDGGCGGDLGL